jgi:polygalacturonase
MLNRRVFLVSAAAAAASRSRAAAADDAGSILARIKPPVFPNRDFDIAQYGADGDGKKLCTDAISQAIAACSAGGGGRVVVPKGVFLTGAIHLQSNVNLHIEKDATLRFSRDPKHYLPVVYTRFEGTECMNYSPFLYAFEQTNIAITGSGTLDGQADCEHWWPWKGRSDCGWKVGDASYQKDDQALISMADRNIPVSQRVFGEGHYLRPNFIQPYRCRNLLIEDVSVVNSPMWEIHPVLCRNVTVRGVNINSHGPNNDGCDPESCADVLIDRCTFDTGDDCIAIKSGRNTDGRRVNVPCENLIVRNCTMQDGHGGVSIGSEVSGSVRNVFVQRCRMDSPNLQRALRMKSNSQRGGTMENVFFRDVTIGNVAEAVIEVDFYYEEGPGGPFNPAVSNINIANVTSKSSKYALYLRGYKDDPIRGITLENCTFDKVAQANRLENVEGLTARNVKINGKAL